MKIVAIISLVIILLIIFGFLYYLLVGALLFKIGFSRRSFVEKGLKKNIEKKLKEYNVDLCWWEKQKPKRFKIQSFDGYNLVGYFLAANSNKTVLLCHGFGGSHWHMQQYAKFFFEKNFSVLAIDGRAHGESEGSCVGFGSFESKDIESWVQFLNERSPENNIVLFGLSMGGTSVCLASGSKNLKNVVAIISDSAFSSASAQIDSILKKYKLSFKLLKKHLYSFARRLYGLDIEKIDAAKSVPSTKVPILFIHGMADEFVPYKNLEILFESAPSSLRDKFSVPEADHIMAYPVSGVLYEKKICDFLKSRTKLD